jgi:uncharacterized membrane protein
MFRRWGIRLEVLGKTIPQSIQVRFISGGRSGDVVGPIRGTFWGGVGVRGLLGVLGTGDVIVVEGASTAVGDEDQAEDEEKHNKVLAYRS